MNTCPYCAEEVKATAKVCPHCRNWLSVFSFRNPVVTIVLAGALFLVTCWWFLTAFNQLMNPGRDFSSYRDSISVLESRMNFQPDASGPMVNVVVVLTNKCEFAWKNPQLDVRFYNHDGTLVDAFTSTGYGVIYPKGEFAFRAKNRPIHPISEYDSCKVYVQSAVDPRSRF